ncbi:helix-turn-helix transcriptional regulator [Streptomyces sp. NPDC001288]
MSIVKLNVRKGGASETVDLDTLTPKARALAEAIAMSFGSQPIGVLCDTGATKGDSPNHAYLHGTGPGADRIGAEPDLRLVTNWGLIPADSPTSAAAWLEENARSIPFDSWPVAGARSRVQAMTERVPSADAAREDRCLTRDQAIDYLTYAGTPFSADGWSRLWKAGHLPEPRHLALGGRLPLWHVDDLDAYARREFQRWTVSQVADRLGYEGSAASGTARKQLSRWGMLAVDRAPGRGGESRFASDQVMALHEARPGRGRHGAQREGGRFTVSQ